jgi:hypothetical protein
MPIDMPVAVSIFKGDFFTPPKVWGDQTYSIFRSEVHCHVRDKSLKVFGYFFPCCIAISATGVCMWSGVAIITASIARSHQSSLFRAILTPQR